MAYQQVRDILAHIQQLRCRIRDHVAAQKAAEHDPMLHALLQRIEDHDQYMAQCLDEQAATAPAGVLDTWVQYPDTQSIEREIAELQQAAEETPERPAVPAKSPASSAAPADEQETSQLQSDAVKEILALDQRLMGLYRTIAEQTHSERVRDFLRQLMLMEDQKVRKQSHSLIQAEDIRRS